MGWTNLCCATFTEQTTIGEIPTMGSAISADFRMLCFSSHDEKNMDESISPVGSTLVARQTFKNVF